MPEAMRAVLLPNVDGFPSESMRRYASELSRALRAAAPPEWTIEEMVCAPDDAVRSRWGEKMASRHARFLKYPRLIRERAGADVYHVLDHSHANLAAVPPAARTILTCHDIIPLLGARGLIPVPYPWLTRYTFPLRLRCMRRCARVIAISESTKRNLVDHAGIAAERIDVVYYGVNPRFGPEPATGARAEERRRLLAAHGLPETARVLLHVATPMRYKNTPAILRALHILRARPDLADNVWFLRIGAGFFEDEQRMIDELRLGDRIAFAGRVSDDALLGGYYRAADVFVFPSLWEGFGWPVLEAMACATPVVTSNVASLPEVVGDAGLTVPPQDHEALAGALHGLLANEDARRRRAEQCLRHAQRFTWEGCARHTFETYESVARMADTPG